MKNKTKFKIWTESVKDTHSDEYCYLRLHPGTSRSAKPNEAIALVACDVDGIQIDAGAILVLDSKLGVIVTLEGISNDIPLKTDIADSPLIYTEAEAAEALRPTFPINMSEVISRMAEHAESCPAHNKEPTLN